jgi:hypothetical protein
MTELRALIRKPGHNVLATDDEFGIKAFESKNVLLKHLPPTDYMPYGQRKFRSCAVVGNSGALLGRNHGAEVSDSTHIVSNKQAERIVVRAPTRSQRPEKPLM